MNLAIPSSAPSDEEKSNLEGHDCLREECQFLQQGTEKSMSDISIASNWGDKVICCNAGSTL